jgi:hypothetical protein
MFSCDCGIRYIGETENLFNRVQDHQQPSKETAVHSHTSECEIFKNNFDSCFTKNNFENRFSFLLDKFEILHRNLDYRERTQFEALEIKLRDPKLNRQIKHKAIEII